MRGFVVASALVLGLGCGAGEISGDGGDPPDGGQSGADGSTGGNDGGNATGEPPEFAGTTAAHNQVRASVGQAPLSWDPDLAAIAQAWVEQCVNQDQFPRILDHNPGRSDNYPGYVGENIFAGSGAVTGVDAVNSWASEAADYDYDSNTCSAVCGHYTQIVWGTTTKVGCAMHTCSGIDFPNTIVCNYAPGGNVNGQRPY